MAKDKVKVKVHKPKLEKLHKDKDKDGDNNWFILAVTKDEVCEEMVKYLKKKGEKPVKRYIDGSFRNFLEASGIGYTETVAFVNGHYVGHLDDIKQLYGE